jgi:hypothetical protein
MDRQCPTPVSRRVEDRERKRGEERGEGEEGGGGERREEWRDLTIN